MEKDLEAVTMPSTNTRINNDTKKRVEALGKYGDSFSSILERLLDDLDDYKELEELKERPVDLIRPESPGGPASIRQRIAKRHI